MRRQNHHVAGVVWIATTTTVVLGACDDLRGSAQPAMASAAAPSSGGVAPVAGNADPCWDFARYACGSARVSGPRLVSRADTMLVRRGENLVRFLQGLHARRVQADDRETVILRDYYDRCYDGAARDRALPELRTQLAELGRITTLEDLARALGQLRALGFTFLVDVHAVAPDRASPDAKVAAVGMARPLVSRENYARNGRAVAQYQQHWRNLAGLSGVVFAPEADAASRIDLALAGLEPDAADASARPRDARRSPEPFPERTVFPWRAYLAAAGVANTLPLMVARPRDLGRVDTLARLPLDDLRSYVRVALLHDEQPYLGLPFMKELRSLVSARVGVQLWFSYELLCPSLLFKTLEPLLADAYLSYLADEPSEEAARRMFEALRARMIRRVQAVPWMDAAARERGVAGLSSVQLRLIGDLESHVLDSASLPEGSFLALELAIRRARVAAYLDGVPRALEPSFAAAAFSPRDNAIWVSPEMVRPPYVRAGAFNAITFGALGAVIGHELGHALDVATNRARSTCVEKIGDELFADERIADIAGVQQALAEMEAELGDDPGDRNGWREEFFLAYAQQLCTYESDHHLEDDPHPPLASRINGTLAHVRAFADTFHCGAGTPLAPDEPCTVW